MFVNISFRDMINGVRVKCQQKGSKKGDGAN